MGILGNILDNPCYFMVLVFIKKTNGFTQWILFSKYFGLLLDVRLFFSPHGLDETRSFASDTISGGTTRTESFQTIQGVQVTGGVVWQM